MSETKQPWPSDPVAFVEQAKQDGTACHWNVELQKFVRESSVGKGENMVVKHDDAKPTDPIFFGLPHCSPEGMPHYKVTDTKKSIEYHPLQMIEGVEVKHLYADVATGCGVYLRTDAYDTGDTSDEGGKSTKKTLGVK